MPSPRSWASPRGHPSWRLADYVVHSMAEAASASAGDRGPGPPVMPQAPEPRFGTFFLPGPTEVRPVVRQAMSGAMMSHRGPEFRALYARVQSGLRIVFCTTRPVFIATSSATGLMEAAIRNALRDGSLLS